MTEIWKAYFEARSKFPKISKGSDGYNYKYADLDSILGAVEPILFQHGFVITNTITTSTDGIQNLNVGLFHVGLCAALPIGCVMPISFKQEPQKIGSAITYFRRYGLLTLLNLCPVEDDDGALASNRPSFQNKNQVQQKQNSNMQNRGGMFP